MNVRAMRLAWIAAAGATLAVAVGLSMYAMRAGISYSLSPSELVAAAPSPQQRIRLFGLVEAGSVQRGQAMQVSFRLGDGAQSVQVAYDDILPDLFRERQGIITEGTLRADGVFVADEVLAKHDENYMPADMAAKLKKEGVWQGAESDTARQ